MDLIQTLRGYSNKEVNRAGTVLSGATNDAQEFGRALEIVSNWRTLHQAPLTLLRTMLEEEAFAADPGSLIVTRLKRIPTITDKLDRQPTMQLSTMQDIGGARVVVDTLLQARVLQERLRSFSPYFKLKLPMKDYILNPNPKSGYRGLHLVFSFQDQTEQYRKLNGLKIELQIRTRLQHVWATAVETVGTFRGESLKSGEGNPDWLEFFRLAGSLFADLETNMGSVPPELAALRDVLEVQERLGAYNLIQSVARCPELHPQWVGAKYVVLVLNLQEGSVRVDWFAADQFAKAVERQREQEARYLGNKNFDTVLVSVDSLTGLHEGYPNYFADTGDFVNLVYGFRPREANYGVWANLREGA